MVTNETMT